MLWLNAYHDSCGLAWREPFGALPCGAEATLRLEVWGRDAGRVHALLRTWHGEEHYVHAVSAEEGEKRVFTFRVKAPDAPCVLWYHFRLHLGDNFFYVGAADAALRSGRSELTRELPHDFRITVYDAAFTVPDAFCGRVAYQIFPDRFFASGRDTGPAIEHHRSLGRRVTVKDWSEEVDYLPRIFIIKFLYPNLFIIKFFFFSFFTNDRI